MTGQLNKSPELFENWVYYCPNSETGLRWLPNQKWRKKDAVAGTVNCETGYAFLSVRKENKKIYYPAHKIVWYLHTKNWPEDNQINHINRNRNDNRFENLEFLKGTEFEIESIQKIERNNIGFWPRYVSWNKRDKKFQGSVRLKNKRKSLGYKNCPNELHKLGVDLTNLEHKRNIEYEFIPSCLNCTECLFLKLLKQS